MTKMVKLSKLKSTIFSLFVLAGLLTNSLGTVIAQAPEPLIFFNPDPAYIYTTGADTTVVNVDVADVVEIRGFDVRGFYDPEEVSIDR